ncbi:MAG TPA: hypothetical protein VGL66_05565 [Caulobacteraceae bacterium]|jgi:hypothetical protein
MLKLALVVMVGAITLPLAARAQDDDKSPGRPRAFACTLKTTEDGFQGDCGILFPDQAAPVLKLKPAAQADSVWREDRLAQRVYRGAFNEGKQASPLELEIYPGGWGILRTEYGWLPVTGFTASPDLAFSLDPTHEIAPSALDERILMRALLIARQGADWNRADDRRCDAHPTSWSLYCAVDRATIEVTGAHDHRRPAMEVVRLLVEERTKDKAYAHRLMGYNNDPKTTLEDIESLLQDALKRVRDEDWLSEHDFVRPDDQGGFTPG